MRIKKRATAIATTVVVAVGIALAGAGSASAFAYTDRYGSAVCINTNNYPTTQSYGVGDVEHQIAMAAGGAGSYYYADFANGSVQQLRTFKSPDHNADWAAFGYSDLWTQTAWFCG